MERSSTASNTMSSQNNPSGSVNPPPNIPAHPTPSDDIGWTWGVMPEWPINKIKVKCKLCAHVSSGGVSRLKQHIAHWKGSVKACPKSTAQDRELALASILSAKEKKIEKAKYILEQRADVQVSKARREEEEELTLIGNKRPREFGPMDRYASSYSSEEHSMPGRSAKMPRQTTIGEAERKKMRELVHERVALWAYEAGIPFHAFTLASFGNLCEAIGQYGPGYIGPTMYQLREPLLKKAKEKTSEDLESHKKLWASNGCTLMTDSWTDRKHRCVMNMCVHSTLGVSFFDSEEESSKKHTGAFIFKWVDKCIMKIGEQNVIQVVTDNHAANMAAKSLLNAKRPRIFWTSCAAHTIDLMLHDIGKIPKFKNTIEKAKGLTKFIYSHHRTLSLMRKCTKKKDIVRPGITRFATSFLTLSSLLEKRDPLVAMFDSLEFAEMTFQGVTKRKAETANATVVSRAFWSSVRFCLKIFSPLFRVLRMVDSDKNPSMGFIVGELQIAKRDIMSAYKNVEREYKPILNIMDVKSKDRLDTPLHMAAWFLNPMYYYADDEEAKKSHAAKLAVLDCAEKFFSDVDCIDKIHTEELLIYKERRGILGRDIAIRGVKKIEETRCPAHWWDLFGGEIPYLQSMAMKILGLTGSSSGCERNWSAFEGIHTKKRNRLDSKRLRDLVFVQFNLKIKSKMNATSKSGKKKDILRSKELRNAASWIVDGCDDSEDEDEFYPGTDIPFRVISEATGADDILEPRRTLRGTSARVAQGQASSSMTEITEIEEEDGDEGDDEDSGSEQDVPLDDESDEEALEDELVLLGESSDDE